MRLWSGIALGLALAIGVAMPITAQDSRGARGIERMDTNKDGKVSQEEWIAYYSDRFTETDANGDGFVTAKEMKDSRGSRGGKKGDREEKTD